MKQKTTEINHPILERLMLIHQKIEKKLYPNCSTLADDFEVSISTINRHIEYLRTRMNAPIEFDKNKNGYYYMKDYDFALNSISQQDLLALSYVKNLLNTCQDTPLYTEIESAISSILKSQLPFSKDLLQRITSPPLPKIIVDEELWKIITKALLTNRILKFNYHGIYNQEKKTRHVAPYQIVIGDNTCGLFGFCQKAKGKRFFAFNRIENPSITEEQFTLPKDYDFNAYCGESYFGAYISEKIEFYEIAFFGMARKNIKEVIWAKDQKIQEIDEEDTTILQFSSPQHQKIFEWVLSKGSLAKPLQPEKLVRYWKQTIKEMNTLL
ncbi:MAG: helix-turn-helix transcriptional regulator [Treponemataceae bacterium]